MTSIYDVAKGDFVLGPDGEWHEIDYIMAKVTQAKPLHYHEWLISTEDGLTFTMFTARQYRTRLRSTLGATDIRNDRARIIIRWYHWLAVFGIVVAANLAANAIRALLGW